MAHAQQYAASIHRKRTSRAFAGVGVPGNCVRPNLEIQLTGQCHAIRLRLHLARKGGTIRAGNGIVFKNSSNMHAVSALCYLNSYQSWVWHHDKLEASPSYRLMLSPARVPRGLPGITRRLVRFPLQHGKPIAALHWGSPRHTNANTCSCQHYCSLNLQLSPNRQGAQTSPRQQLTVLGCHKAHKQRPL